MPTFNRTASDTGLSITTAAPQRFVSRAQPTTTGLTVSDSTVSQRARFLTDTGMTMTDSLARTPARTLSDYAFVPDFAVGTSLLDNFLRANENPLSGGGRWTRTGTYGGPCSLVSHAVRGISTTILTSSYSAAGDLTDCEVWATLSSLPTGLPSFQFLGLYARQDPGQPTGKAQYNVGYETGTLFLGYTDASGGSHALGSNFSVTLAVGDSIGLRVVGSTITAYYKPAAGSWTAVITATDTNLTHGYIGVVNASDNGGLTNFGGGALGLRDSAFEFNPHLPLLTDTGLTVTDSIARNVLRYFPLSDTGLTVSDALVTALNGNVSVSLTDTGLPAVSDALQKAVSKLVADTGLAVADAIVHAYKQFRLIIDTGLTVADSIQKVASKLVTDTGLTVSDSPSRSHPVSITTTGLTITDSLASIRRHFIRNTDTGLTLTTTLVATKNGHNPSVNITDIGLVLSVTLADTEHYFRTVNPNFSGDRGLSITDAIRVAVNGGAPNACDSDFLRFLMDLEASSDYTAWCAANPIDCGTWTEYANAIINGGTPSPPTMTDDFGTALVDAGIIALDGIVPCRDRPPPRTSPVAAFTSTVSGLTAAFLNESVPGASGMFASWLWTFGDGNTDTTTWSPHHTYASAGTYLVTLTVVGAGGDGMSSVSHPVTVFVPGVVGFHIDAVIV